MRIEYVFIRKEDAVTHIGQGVCMPCPPLHVVLRKIFPNVSDNTIEVKYKTQTYQLSYHSVDHQCTEGKKISEIQYLSINMEGKSKQRVAEVMNFVHQQIFVHEEKSHYDIIVSYDGISKYYCDRIYPLLNEFERQIRNLIFKLLTRCFGALWLEKTTTEEQQNDIKSKLQISSKRLRNQKMIEEALYEMDIKDLENYLFMPRSSMSAMDLRSEDFTDERLKSLSQDKLVELAQQLRPLSLWERYFEKEVEIDSLQDKLQAIRLFRNKVAHAKHFHKQDYSECKKILDKILPQLEIAIVNVSVQKYDDQQMQAAVNGIADVCTSTMKRALGLGMTVPPIIDSFGKSILVWNQMLEKQTAFLRTIEAQQTSMHALSSVLNTLSASNVVNEIVMAQMNVQNTPLFKSIQGAKVAFPQPMGKMFQQLQSSIPEPAILKSIRGIERITQPYMETFSRLSSLYRMSDLISSITRVPNMVTNGIGQVNMAFSDSELPDDIDFDGDMPEFVDSMEGDLDEEKDEE